MFAFGTGGRYGYTVTFNWTPGWKHFLPTRTEMHMQGDSGPTLADSPTKTTFGAYRTEGGTAPRKRANVEPKRRERFNQFRITTLAFQKKFKDWGWYLREKLHVTVFLSSHFSNFAYTSRLQSAFPSKSISYMRTSHSIYSCRHAHTCVYVEYELHLECSKLRSST